MSIGSTLKETFSLSNIFKFAVISVPLFLVFGVIDLAIWHYMPGGVELFHTIKEPLLNNPVSHGLSDFFNNVATMFGGGMEVTAKNLGGTLDPMSGAFIPEY